jgi:Gametolysin peptidase M11
MKTSAGLLFLLLVIPLVAACPHPPPPKRDEGPPCLFKVTRQFIELLPPPVNGARICSKCSFDPPTCMMHCAGGCKGSRSSTNNLWFSLAGCDPRRDRIAITSNGKVDCVKMKNVTVSGEWTVVLGHDHSEASALTQKPAMQAFLEPFEGGGPLRFDFRKTLLDLDRYGVKLQSGDTATVSLLTEDAKQQQQQSGKILGAKTLSLGTQRDIVINGVPVLMTSVTAIVNLCGSATPITPDIVRRYWFNRHAANPGYDVTLERMFATCSRSTLLWEEPDNIIVGPVNVSCRGTIYGRKYDLSRCDSSFSRDSREVVSLALRNQFGISVGEYKRFMMILAPGRNLTQRIAAGCTWSGLGQLGGSRQMGWPSWVFSGVTYDPRKAFMGTLLPMLSLETIFQELMHNTGLFHSTRRGTDGSIIDYGERPDPMGNGDVDGRRKGALVCPNAVQSWKAGWTQLLHDIAVVPSAATDENLVYTSPEGDMPRFLAEYTTASLVLPSLAVAPKGRAAVRVVLGPQVGSLRRSIILSYRTRGPEGPGSYDFGLRDGWHQRVYVHEFYGMQSRRQDPYMSPNGDSGVMFTGGTPPMLWAMLANSTTMAALRRKGDHVLYPVPKGLTGAALDTARRVQFNVSSEATLDLARNQGLVGPYTFRLGKASALTIRVVASNATHATVTLCRSDPKVTNESTAVACLDGLDNDCDGLVDLDDPDCQGVLSS